MNQYVNAIFAVAALSCALTNAEDDEFLPAKPDAVFPINVDEMPQASKRIKQLSMSTQTTMSSCSSSNFSLDQFETKLDSLDEKLTITSRDKDWSLTILALDGRDDLLVAKACDSLSHRADLSINGAKHTDL